MKGPYLYIALACQSIPEDGKMPVENLPGKVTVEGNTEEMHPFPFTFTLFIGLIAGEYTGKAKIDIQPVAPSGEESPALSVEVEFEEPLNYRVNVKTLVEKFIIKQQGIYWFDLKLENHLMGRIPIEVEYRQAKTIPYEQDS